MDKQFLKRLAETLKQIKADLLLVPEIRKLLYYDSDVIKTTEEEEKTLFVDMPVPDMQLAKEHIFLQPIIEVDNEPPFNKKTFIAVTSPSMGFDTENSVEYTIKISIQCDKTNWIYGKDNIRVYDLAQEVVNCLEGRKYACALKLRFEQMLETVTDKVVTGKSLLFSIGDGVGE